MYIKEFLTAGKTAVSLEFFPPKTPEGWTKLFNTVSELSELHPVHMSVTYGAGGTTRTRTHELVTRLNQNPDIEVAAHLTCIGHSRDEIKTILDNYADNGIRNILALKGDFPKSEDCVQGDFPYAADLVHYIRRVHPEMGIGVAGFPEGHPDSRNRLVELDYLKEKIDAGADYIVTQLFFDNRDYYDYVDRCAAAGIVVPIIAGIMPITSKSNMSRMADLAPRTRFPAGLIRAIERTKTVEGVSHAGIHWAAEQIRDLLDNSALGIHLYTLNKANTILRICSVLGLEDFRDL